MPYTKLIEPLLSFLWIVILVADKGFPFSCHSASTLLKVKRAEIFWPLSSSAILCNVNESPALGL